MMLQMEIWCVLLLLLGLSTALVCPDGGMCEDRNTCCKNMVGGYGCCPLPHAECCSDHLHCCYEGTLCDLVHEQCVNKTVSLPWMRRLPAQPAPPVARLGENVKKAVCPDQKSTCDDDSTCCQLLDGSWGCCPLLKAVCCEDKLHCCPEGTQCDTAREICVSASLESFPMMKKLPAGRREKNPATTVGSVTCPGGTSSCPDSYTCCLLTSGDYGCCPFPQAMCCSDHLHCCPSNTQCDLEHGVCKSGNVRVPLLKKILATPNDVQCPDKATACPDQTTCCQMTNGSYGCCPMPNAVCCSDHMHCCPEGTQCDLQHSTCVSAQRDAVVASRVTTAATAKSRVGSVPCNDSVSCADGSTCCKMLDREWACCPLPQAVCCDDHEHCCPHGTICNLAASTCDDPSGLSALLPWTEKVAATPRLRIEPAFDSQCDKSTLCPGKSTCCRTATGGWACCPLPQAVCCDDHVHCCPHATVCNLEAETCDDPSGLSAPLHWKEKVAALRSDVQCDEQTSCPGGSTCCKGSSGRWSCCPLPQAACCDDHEHCCPAGYSCDVAKQTCNKPGGARRPWLRKIPALQQLQQNEPDRAGSVLLSRDRNMCDAHTSCPRDTTCCFMDQSHRWGCCPLPKAVCCEDGNHCCPAGHTCQPHRSSCSKGPHVVPWFRKLSALMEPSAPTATDVKCDDKSSCASGTTCCKLSTGEWGCCPLVKAVCCTDQEHCCPQGYTCNMQTGTCEKKNLDDGLVHASVPQSQVVRPEPGRPEDEEGDDIPCDAAGSVRCSGQETCCKTSPTDWACCPSPRATCCSDLKHCCPAGYSCDPTAGGCTPEDTRPTWDVLFGDRRRDYVPQGL